MPSFQVSARVLAVHFTPGLGGLLVLDLESTSQYSLDCEDPDTSITYDGVPIDDAGELLGHLAANHSTVTLHPDPDRAHVSYKAEFETWTAPPDDLPLAQDVSGTKVDGEAVQF